MVTASSSVSLVNVGPAFDLNTAAAVKERLSSLLHQEQHVVLDLRDTTLDSTGLGAILSMKRRLELQGRLLLVVGQSPELLDLLNRTGVGNVLLRYAHPEDALAFAEEHAGILEDDLLFA